MYIHDICMTFRYFLTNMITQQYVGYGIDGQGEDAIIRGRFPSLFSGSLSEG